VVVNGDDASWIEAEEVRCEGMIRQQDGFHLARVCWRAFEKEQGHALYEALWGGDMEKVQALWEQARPCGGKRARGARAWLEKHLWDPGLRDWRRRVLQARIPALQGHVPSDPTLLRLRDRLRLLN